MREVGYRRIKKEGKLVEVLSRNSVSSLREKITE